MSSKGVCAVHSSAPRASRIKRPGEQFEVRRRIVLTGTAKDSINRWSKLMASNDGFLAHNIRSAETTRPSASSRPPRAHHAENTPGLGVGSHRRPDSPL
jgi:hypothetical protein